MSDKETQGHWDEKMLDSVEMEHKQTLNDCMNPTPDTNYWCEYCEVLSLARKGLEADRFREVLKEIRNKELGSMGWLEFVGKLKRIASEAIYNVHKETNKEEHQSE